MRLVWNLVERIKGMQTLFLIGEAEMTRFLTADKGDSGCAALEDYLEVFFFRLF